MHRRSMRFLALWLCLLLLLVQAVPALAAKKKTPVAVQPLTASESVYTQDGAVLVTGQRAKVDFDWLKSVNAHSVAWLYQEETALSQPVLQSPVDDYYRNRGFDGSNVGKKGMAYLAASARSDLQERQVMIYGSGREGGSLYSFSGYRKQPYYSEHPSVRLLTPQGDWQADVFACVKTNRRNLDKWCVQKAAESFDEWIGRVIDGSEIKPEEGCIPQLGQRTAVFAALGSDERCDLIFATLRPIRYETDETVDLNKADMDRSTTESGYVQVNEFGQKMVYAQNDSLWGMMRYESALTDKFRRFNGGGCGPTAAAIVVANLVDVQDLPKIRQYAANGLGTLFCPCSVNRVYCNHLHPPYHLETGEEYLRYLPVIMADFAAGNNQWGINSRPITSVGSNMRFFEPLCEIYGLSLEPVSNTYEGLLHMRERGNQGLLLCVALRGSPFTSTSHYVVVAGVDDTYFYVLDPLFRTDYSDQLHDEVIEEILSPGVVKIKLDNVRQCGLNIVGYVEKQTEKSE